MALTYFRCPVQEMIAPVVECVARRKAAATKKNQTCAVGTIPADSYITKQCGRCELWKSAIEDTSMPAADMEAHIKATPSQEGTHVDAGPLPTKWLIAPHVRTYDRRRYPL